MRRNLICIYVNYPHFYSNPIHLISAITIHVTPEPYVKPVEALEVNIQRDMNLFTDPYTI